MNPSVLLAIIQLIQAGLPGALQMYQLIQQNIQNSQLPPAEELLDSADALYAKFGADVDAEIARVMAQIKVQP